MFLEIMKLRWNYAKFKKNESLYALDVNVIILLLSTRLPVKSLEINYTIIAITHCKQIHIPSKIFFSVVCRNGPNMVANTHASSALVKLKPLRGSILTYKIVFTHREVTLITLPTLKNLKKVFCKFLSNCALDTD